MSQNDFEGMMEKHRQMADLSFEEKLEVFLKMREVFINLKEEMGREFRVDAQASIEVRTD